MSAPRSTHSEVEGRYPRRNLRPRQERSYAESPDVVLLSDEEPRINGFTNGFDGEDSDEGELPPIPSPPIKVNSTNAIIFKFFAGITFCSTYLISNL